MASSSQSLGAALLLYAQGLSKSDIAKLHTSVIRYLLPHWNALLPQTGKSLTHQEIELGLEFAHQVSLDDLQNLDKVERWQSEIFEKLGTSPGSRRQYKHHLKKFLQACENKGWFTTAPVAKSSTRLPKVCAPRLKGKPGCWRPENRLTKKKILEPYSYRPAMAGAIDGRVDEDSALATSTEERESKLELQLSDFYSFWHDSYYPQARPIEQTVSKATLRIRLEGVYRLLGWLRIDKAKSLDTSLSSEAKRGLPIPRWLRDMAKAYPPVPTEQLCLELLMPLVSIKGVEDLERVQRKEVQEKAFQAARKTSALASAYIHWLRWQHNPTDKPDEVLDEQGHPIAPGTEALILDALLTVAKYLYRNEIEAEEDYANIPVIKELRRERRKTAKRVKEWTATSDESKKWLSWPEFCALVQTLKQECAKFYIGGKKRSVRSIARSYRRYLMLAWLRYLPPDRQRTLRELQVGRTLRRGWIKSGIFTPATWSPEARRYINDEGAKWFTYLEVQDSKIRTKLQQDELPPILGSALDEWLYRGYQDGEGNWHGWREAFPPSDFVFPQLTGKQMQVNGVTGIFQRSAFNKTGKKLNPHLIRNICASYYNDKASDAEQRSLCSGMRHSLKTHRDKYTKAKAWERSRLGIELLQKEPSFEGE
ncbi:site-specific integrase [Leptolyngbya sp. FACHB-261]|uniref:site-specific integrase n=1 Tax=Leptolyngbya sp. FACHB-261 TaxID=2692806 RepID=UPI0016849E79|nr:site-specific integrase [Leptolyngbya sp. FACHB-261]MBD2105327.1 site-specific integrase [Leptolyngbya sp. FACHB-261]